MEQLTGVSRPAKTSQGGGGLRRSGRRASRRVYSPMPSAATPALSVGPQRRPSASALRKGGHVRDRRSGGAPFENVLWHGLGEGARWATPRRRAARCSRTRDGLGAVASGQVRGCCFVLGPVPGYRRADPAWEAP